MKTQTSLHTGHSTFSLIQGAFRLLILLATSCVSAQEAAMPADGMARLFILSGQSNMAALNPDDTFTPALRAAFPKDQIVIVKDTENGQPLRRWFAKDQARDLYKRLFEKVVAETGKQTFDSVTFIWMQGEADASWAEDSGRYEAHMKGLIQQLRSDLKNEEMTVVIGRISKHFSGTAHGDKVREVQVQVAESDPQAGWIDTDDLARGSDDIHFSKEGRTLLGQRFAKKAIALITNKAK